MRRRFQSSFELTGYITILKYHQKHYQISMFQSSFELTGYITESHLEYKTAHIVSKLFRAYGLYNEFIYECFDAVDDAFQSSFELTGYITHRPLQVEV